MRASLAGIVGELNSLWTLFPHRVRPPDRRSRTHTSTGRVSASRPAFSWWQAVRVVVPGWKVSLSEQDAILDGYGRREQMSQLRGAARLFPRLRQLVPSVGR